MFATRFVKRKSEAHEGLSLLAQRDGVVVSLLPRTERQEVSSAFARFDHTRNHYLALHHGGTQRGSLPWATGEALQAFYQAQVSSTAVKVLMCKIV